MNHYGGPKPRLFNIDTRRQWRLLPPPYLYHNLCDYGDTVERMLRKPEVGYKRFPCVMPGWDNSPRRPKYSARIFKNSTPDLYEKWLRGVLRRFRPYSRDENFVFLNAWNEWAE